MIRNELIEVNQLITSYSNGSIKMFNQLKDEQMQTRVCID